MKKYLKPTVQTTDLRSLDVTCVTFGMGVTSAGSQEDAM